MELFGCSCADAPAENIGMRGNGSTIWWAIDIRAGVDPTATQRSSISHQQLT
jgi:hypothetical protein